VLHRIDGFLNQIDDHLDHEGSIGRNHRQRHGQGQLYRHGVVLQLCFQKLQRFPDECIDIAMAWTGAPAANEVTHSADDSSRPQRLLTTPLQSGGECVLVETGRGQHSQAGIVIAGDGHQRLVDFVGKRRRDFRQRRNASGIVQHLLMLPLQRLGMLRLRNIGDYLQADTPTAFPRDRSDLYQIPSASGMIAHLARDKTRAQEFTVRMVRIRAAAIADPESFGELFGTQHARVGVDQAREGAVGIDDSAAVVICDIDRGMQLFQYAKKPLVRRVKARRKRASRRTKVMCTASITTPSQ
jgi:hypothetical protein